VAYTRACRPGMKKLCHNPRLQARRLAATTKFLAAFRHRWRQPSVAAAIVLTLAACSPTLPPPVVDRYFPLQANDTWVYEVVQPLRNVRARMTARVRGEQYVKPLHRTCLVVDETYDTPDAAQQALRDQGLPRDVQPVAYYRDNGFFHRALSLEYADGEVREAGPNSGENRFLPVGLRPDADWQGVTTAYDAGGKAEYTVMHTHHATLEPAEVVVPAGRFADCVRVDTVALHGDLHDGQYQASPVVLYYSDWYAPDVGLVRSVQRERADGGLPLAQVELIAYDVKGAVRPADGRAGR
jgi:hypothetical protein